MSITNKISSTESCSLLSGNKGAELDHTHGLPKKIVENYFNGANYYRIGTIGDGSCFFHSICLALNVRKYVSKDTKERQEIAHKMRKILCHRITQHEYDTLNHSTTSFDDFKKKLLDPKIWAEEIMIRWTSKHLGLNIIFVNLGDEKNTVFCGVHDKGTAEDIARCKEPNTPMVIVAWVGFSHFELICRDDGDSLRVMFDPKNEKDLKTIESVMSAYNSKCKLFD